MPGLYRARVCLVNFLTQFLFSFCFCFFRFFFKFKSAFNLNVLINEIETGHLSHVDVVEKNSTFKEFFFLSCEDRLILNIPLFERFLCIKSELLNIHDVYNPYNAAACTSPSLRFSWRVTVFERNMFYRKSLVL